MSTIQTRHGPIAYFEYSEKHKIPLIVLHANAGSHHDFDSIIPALSRTYRVIGLDWPGFGDSPAPDNPSLITGTWLTDIVEDLVHSLKLEKVIFLGSSIGGYAASSYTIKHPRSVLVLILVDSGGFTAHTWWTRFFCYVKGKEWSVRYFDGLFSKFYLKERNSFVHNILNRTNGYRKDSSRVAVNAALWRNFTRPEYSLVGRTHSILCPTLIAWGENDLVATLKRDGNQVMRSIPHAQFVTFKTVYMPFAEDPEAFLGAMQSFLQEISMGKEHNL